MRSVPGGEFGLVGRQALVVAFEPGVRRNVNVCEISTFTYKP